MKRRKYYFGLLLSLLVLTTSLSGNAWFFTKNSKSLKPTSDTLTEKQASSQTSKRDTRALFSSKRKRKPGKTMPNTSVINVRSFQEPMTEAEKEDVKYVLESCANMSTFALAMEQSQIKAALLRIQEVHPLVLLEEIFKNSLLTQDLLKLKSRDWIWTTFHSKLTEALALVAERQLLPRDVMSSFAKNLNLEEASIISLLENGKWDEFLNILVKE